MRDTVKATKLPRRWVLEDTEKPWTTNAERTWHFHKRARMVRDCRERFAWLAIESRVPHLQRVNVQAVPLTANRRGLQDVGACYPAVKAAIDGLVDAGVLIDDDPTHVRSIQFFAPQVIGRHGLRLIVEEVLP